VRHSHAFGTTGRARGVDEIRELIGRNRRARELAAVSFGIDLYGRTTCGSHALCELGSREYPARSAVRENVLESFLRVARLERQVRSTRSEDAEEGDGKVQRA
jgi:hypothetical protein